MPPQVLTELSPKVAFIIASVVIAIMGVTMIGFGWVPHLSQFKTPIFMTAC